MSIHFILLLIFIPIYSTYFIVKTFSCIYTSEIDFSLLDMLPINFAYISEIIKYIFPFSIYFASLIITILLFKNEFKIKKKTNNNFDITTCTNDVCLYIGNNQTGEKIFLDSISLYQNILITGAIGSGKTSCTIYPFLKQLLSFEQISGLILDVKGNMKSTIMQFCNNKHLIVIELLGKYKYNPLHKPHLKPQVLADRLVTILKLFSNTQSVDSYWFDKASQMLTESIKLIRLYNNNYVDFEQLHNIITSPQYLQQKIEYVKNLFLNNKLDVNEQFNFNTVLSYFKSEYINLDNRILSIIISEITRLTLTFINDIDIKSTFCPPKEEINFYGFENTFDNNEVILLNISIGEHPILSKIICAYLKLDYQSEVLKRNFPTTPTFFVCDEYQEYITANDANYFSLSREFKAINIVSTQSYSSLLNTLNNEKTLNVITQSLINKLFLRTDDIYTIEQCQKLFGKEEKTKISNSISENAQETNYNYLLNIMRSKKSNISETISSYTYVDNLFDTKDFSLNLASFEAIAYLYKGPYMLSPMKLKLNPYFKKE